LHLRVVLHVLRAYHLVRELDNRSGRFLMFQIYADASNILKVRLCFAVMFNVLVVATFSHAGQMLIDEVSIKLNFSSTKLI
jgi:hypothetical protein